MLEYFSNDSLKVLKQFLTIPYLVFGHCLSTAFDCPPQSTRQLLTVCVLVATRI
jgi:hypothetical protein